METADAVLMGDDLRQVPFDRLGRRTRTQSAQHQHALGIKALVFMLAARGVATL